MTTIGQWLDLYDAGRLSRRALLGALGAAAAMHGGGTLAQPAPAAPAAGAPVFQALGFDHIAIRSPDPERSARFYERMFGARRLTTGPPSARFLAFGPHALNIFQSQRAGLDHFCFLLDDYTQEEAARRIRAAGEEPILEESTRAFVLDPDGLKVQVGAKGAGGQ